MLKNKYAKIKLEEIENEKTNELVKKQVRKEVWWYDCYSQDYLNHNHLFFPGEESPGFNFYNKKMDRKTKHIRIDAIAVGIIFLGFSGVAFTDKMFFIFIGCFGILLMVLNEVFNPYGGKE